MIYKRVKKSKNVSKCVFARYQYTGKTTKTKTKIVVADIAD